ncbi:efflux RND transporter periplasmic adaptor subunit [Bythopirellula polymerisocia]|uniref:Putative efflux pump membrane fusion protein n=1 Tax=Bythopirellula polymerisocia TaxID=2528003 RepID=A0A5C6CBW7_9BACT|nr:efflux RND transporter periplasmic adaptor subunit [Bythopirellula polymerisocia]TWU20896.1 putative efflux pump membrane fusion protein [Bythopirellula polymerisocia]
MKALTERILHYTILIVVTIFSAIVMWKLSAKSQMAESHMEAATRPLSAIAIPKAPVAVEPLAVETCEIYSTYAGKIQPWEIYQVGFEVPGRVLQLGVNAAGKPLDEGDRVVAGQILALMDDRVFVARKEEAAARVAQANSDLERAQQVRVNSPSALSAAEIQRLVTEVALAKAQLQVAVKNLEDATLTSPVDATISKRMIKSGESVGGNQIVFELVQDDKVLLVVDVPESQIRELENRQREVAECRQNASQTTDVEACVFRARVHLEGTDSFGNSWPELFGEVYHIPEVADTRTGLFPVEIELANEDHHLRSGMVATADVVTNRVRGYSIPEVAVLFRAHRAYLFSVEQERADMEVLYWNLGSAKVYRARQIELPQWVDQGPRIVVPAESVDLENAITRGQYRLSDGQLVRVVDSPSVPPAVAVSTQPTTSGPSER